MVRRLIRRWLLARSSRSTSSRGQLYSLEAFLGLLIIGGTILVISTGLAVPVAVESPEDSREEVIAAQATEAALAQAQENGGLHEAVLGWSPQDNSFVDDTLTPTTAEGYFVFTPENSFGRQLQTIERTHNVTMNVRLIPGENGTTAAQGGTPKEEGIYYLKNGIPPQETVTVSTQITLYASDHLLPTAGTHSHRLQPVEQGSGEGDRLRDVSAGEYPIPERPDAGTAGVYNTVIVEVVIWDD